MINIPANLISCGLCVSLMLVILLSARKNFKSALYDDKLFYRMCFLCLSLSIIEFLGFLVDGKQFPTARFWNIATNTILFLGNTIFVFTWYWYSLFKLKGERFDWSIKSFIPMSFGILSILLTLVNLIHPVYFTVSQDNIYQRMPTVILAYISTYGYMFASVVIIIRNAKRLDRYVFMPIFVFLMPIIAGSLAQFFVYGLGLIWVSCAFGLTSLYISIQNEFTLLDSVTKLYNREFFTRYLRGLKASDRPGMLLGGIMIDINAFKKINDTYGHDEGDKALLEVAKMLKSACTERDRIIRYGGDEFIVIRYVKSPRDLDPVMDNINKVMKSTTLGNDNKRYKLSLSMGLGVMDPSVDSTDDFLRTLDKRMYQAKNLYYNSLEVGEAEGEQKRNSGRENNAIENR